MSVKNFMSPHPSYGGLLPLRCLMLKENFPEKFEKLLQLQSKYDDEKVSNFKTFIESVEKFIPR